MKRLFSLVLCLLFTFVALGGNIYIHKCGENTFLSLYAQLNSESCPLCATEHQDQRKSENKQNCKSKCQDDVIAVDQLSDTDLSTSQPSFVQLYPAITSLLWIVQFTIPLENISNQYSNEYQFAYADSSPPTYLLNCIFRI